MRSSLLNNSCNDNNVQNQLFFFTFTNFLNYIFRRAKIIQLKYNCNYVKTVITFERDKSITSIEAFRDCYISSLNKENLHSLLLITSALGASFSSLLRRPSNSRTVCGESQLTLKA